MTYILCTLGGSIIGSAVTVFIFALFELNNDL
jgi:hypothetical protein